MAALPPLPKAARRARRFVNPDAGRDDEAARLRRAVDIYEGFHWGRKAKKVKRRAVSPSPRAAAKLGKLAFVTYETRKKGDVKPVLYEHQFGEDGGKRPDLVVDVDTGKLHIVGGDYKVEDRGIVD